MAHDSPTGCDLLMWIRDVPEKTGRKPGQVVNVQDCPHKGWGAGERPPDFKIVHVPDRRKADMAHLMEIDTRYHANSAEEDMMRLDPQTRTMLRRRRHVDLDALDPVDRDVIKSVPSIPECEMPWSKLAGKDVDDRGSGLEFTLAQEDRTDALDRLHAEIEAGITEAPPGYVKPARDFSAHVTDIDNEVAVSVAMGHGKPLGYKPPEVRGIS